MTDNPHLSVPLHNSLCPTKSLGDVVLCFAVIRKSGSDLLVTPETPLSPASTLPDPWHLTPRWWVIRVWKIMQEVLRTRSRNGIYDFYPHSTGQIQSCDLTYLQRRMGDNCLPIYPK